jgi:hypothetical protein
MTATAHEQDRLADGDDEGEGDQRRLRWQGTRGQACAVGEDGEGQASTAPSHRDVEV